MNHVLSKLIKETNLEIWLFTNVFAYKTFPPKQSALFSIIDLLNLPFLAYSVTFHL